MSTPLALQDEQYRAAVIDLLAVIGYGEIAAFERLTQDAAGAPSMADKIGLLGLAAREFGNYERLAERLRDLGADPLQVMQGFAVVIDAFHDRTAPADWWEGLMKAYVGQTLVADFYREIAAFLDVDTQALVLQTLGAEAPAAFAEQRLKDLINRDEVTGARLALFGRRLMGEALAQAQRVAAERDAMTALLTGGVGRAAMDLAALSRMFTRLTENHTARMESLGLHA